MQEKIETLRLAASIAVRVLYEDRYLMAVDKPPGLMVAPAHWEQTRRNIMLMLREGVERGVEWARRRNLRFIANVHRLDAGTSGVLLLAKNRPALSKMSDRFEERRVEKVYFALVKGRPLNEEFTVDEPLAQHPTIIGVMIADRKNGREALTRFRLIEQLGEYALLRAEPATGRTHQLRVHLSSAKLPIVGDEIYGLSIAPNKKEPMERLALHAAELGFKHPFTHHQVRIESPLPKDFARAIEQLRRRS